MSPGSRGSLWYDVLGALDLRLLFKSILFGGLVCVRGMEEGLEGSGDGTVIPTSHPVFAAVGDEDAQNGWLTGRCEELVRCELLARIGSGILTVLFNW